MLRRWAANESAIVALARSREKYNNFEQVASAMQIWLVTLLAKVYPNVTLRHQRARDKHMKIDEIRIYIPVRRAWII